MINYTVDLGLFGKWDLDIDYDYSPGTSDTREEPGEPAELMITKITHEGHAIEDELFTLLADALDDNEAFREAVGKVEYAKDLADAKSYAEDLAADYASANGRWGM